MARYSYGLVFQKGEKMLLPNFKELDFKCRPGRSVYKAFQNRGIFQVVVKALPRIYFIQKHYKRQKVYIYIHF